MGGVVFTSTAGGKESDGIQAEIIFMDQANSEELQLLRKMRGSLLLLSALLLLESTDGNGYDQLSQHDTNIIDKAIKEANERHGKTKHLDFDSIISSDSDKRMLNVLLKPTTCDRTKPFVHRKNCEIRNEKPQVSCVECRGNMTCFLLREQEKIKQTVDKCLHPTKRSHITGGGTLLSQTAENEQQTGCLGCI
ncbi:Cystatin-like protein [Anabarilius grahami]|uniref:Cystatin-like protein n=1 Tax=Anabarilius grahami TaxID=495550 RepID=A0A3N0YFE8_ANAGA|nr:Cystatin-like protein [Anabarilius grahami]